MCKGVSNATICGNQFLLTNIQFRISQTDELGFDTFSKQELRICQLVIQISADFWILPRDFDRFSNEFEGFTRFRVILKLFGESYRAFGTIDRLSRTG